MPLVWITGASRGLGKALAIEIAASDYDLLLSARDSIALEHTAETCSQVGKGRIEVLAFDMRDSQSIDEALSQMASLPDIVIHNAGISQRSEIQATENSVYTTVFDTNFFSVVRITHHLLQNTSHKMHLAFVSSIAGVHGIPLRGAYSSAKSALNRYVETLQAELRSSQITCSLVIPGTIQTDISTHALQADASLYGKSDPAQEKGIPAKDAAKKTWYAIEQKKQRIYVGMTFRHWFLCILHRIAPSATSALLARALRKGRLV